MQTVEFRTKRIESSGELIIEGEDLPHKLAEVDGCGGLVFHSQSFPTRSELSLVGPFGLSRRSRTILDSLIDNVAGRGRKDERAFEFAEGFGEIPVDFVLASRVISR